MIITKPRTPSQVIEIAAKSKTPDAACKAIATAVIKKYGTKNTKPNDDLTILAAYFTQPEAQAGR